MMSKTVSMDIDFDGDVERLAGAVREGAAFSYNGKPLPLAHVIVQGDRLIVAFAHRSLIVDLSHAILVLQGCSSVRLRMNFVK